jgi:hypothetical protein
LSLHFLIYMREFITPPWHTSNSCQVMQQKKGQASSLQTITFAPVVRQGGSYSRSTSLPWPGREKRWWHLPSCTCIQLSGEQEEEEEEKEEEEDTLPSVLPHPGQSTEAWGKGALGQ